MPKNSLPYVDTESNMARVARMMGEFAQELKDDIERERNSVLSREAQE